MLPTVIRLCLSPPKNAFFVRPRPLAAGLALATTSDLAFFVPGCRLCLRRQAHEMEERCSHGMILLASREASSFIRRCGARRGCHQQARPRPRSCSRSRLLCLRTGNPERSEPAQHASTSKGKPRTTKRSSATPILIVPDPTGST